MKFEEHNPDTQAIGFVIYDDGTFVFANPCSIPLKFLEDAIKKHKKRKVKKGEVTVCCFISIPNLKFKIKGVKTYKK